MGHLGQTHFTSTLKTPPDPLNLPTDTLVMISNITDNRQPPDAVVLVVVLVAQGALVYVPSLILREAQGLLRVVLVVAELMAALAAARCWST